MNRALPLILLAAIVSAADQGGYLFVTFNNEGPQGEQIYFGLSRDGHRWGALNGTKPVLISKLGEQGVRDPFITRTQDGKGFVIIATDLCMHRNGNWTRAVRQGSKSIVIWDSADLTHWSEPRLVKVSPDDAGCTWAPEASYDASTQDYLVYWASMSGRDNYSKQRIWASRTKDFITFGTPFIYIEKPQHVIDTTIVHDGNAYYRFSKDESFKAITMEVGPALSGPWQEFTQFSLARMQGYEGPTCFRLRDEAGKPGKWCLLLDHYAKGAGYEAFVTDDLAKGQFIADKSISFSFRFRHGTSLPVTETEYQRLVTTYGEPTFAK